MTNLSEALQPKVLMGRYCQITYECIRANGNHQRWNFNFKWMRCLTQLKACCNWAMEERLIPVCDRRKDGDCQWTDECEEVAQNFSDTQWF